MADGKPASLDRNRQPTPLAGAARKLVAAARRGVLCTLIPEDGYPYGSLVELLCPCPMATWRCS